MVMNHKTMQLSNIFPRIMALTIVLAAFLPARIGQASPGEQNSPISLQQAINEGRVEAVGVPLERGIKQPNLQLTISSISGENLTVEIAAGTVFAANEGNFATLVVPESQVVEVVSSATVNLDTFSMQSGKDYPSKWTPTEYKYSIVLDDARLLGLFDTAREKGYGVGYEMQLAVWMTLENKSLAEITAPMKTKPTQHELEMAQCIFDGGSCSVAPPPTNLPPLTVTKAVTQESAPTQAVPTEAPQKKGGAAGTILIVFGILAALAGGTFYFLGKHNKPKDVAGQETQTQGGTGWDWESPKHSTPAEPAKPVPTPPTPPKPAPVPPPPPKPARQVTSIKLQAVSGPYLGKVFSGVLPFILSRDELEVVVIPETTLSAPHALLYLGEGEVEVKDMNSSNGVVVNSSRLPAGWQKLTLGTNIKFGRAEIAISGNSFQIISGDAAGNFYGPFTDNIVVSREDINVVSLGDQDGQISSAHVLFSLVDDQIQVRDLDSRYGTRINGQAAGRDQVLQPDDRIQLGSSIFIYKID